MSTVERIRGLAVDGGSRNWVLVIVETSDGVVGLGEATLEWHTEAVLASIQELAPLAVGRPSNQIHGIWQHLKRSRFWTGGPILMSALSGIEQALWDAKGRAAGIPVYEMLGGKCRDRLLLYGNFPNGVGYAEMAEVLKREGLTGVKITPFDEALLAVDGRRPTLQRAIDAVGDAREALGPDCRLAIDLHGRVSAAMAIVFARAVEELDIWFLEEPSAPGDIAGLAKVARSTIIPIAAGERVLERKDFTELIQAGQVSMVQPDLAHCGGIFEGRAIAAIAEAHDVGFAPHNPLSDVNTMATAHVAVTSPNFIALERKIGDNRAQASIFHSTHKIVDGYLHISDEPGLGLELDESAAIEHPPGVYPVPDERGADGAVVDW